ncbi:hypothetical protein D3C81_1981910 [compost metagenome]
MTIIIVGLKLNPLTVRVLPASIETEPVADLLTGKLSIAALIVSHESVSFTVPPFPRIAPAKLAFLLLRNGTKSCNPLIV